MKHLVTGGAGFIGSHLINKLINEGEEVICLDNFFTGNIENIKFFINNTKFDLIEHDIVDPISVKVDKIWHLACPASPRAYQSDPIKTAKVCFLGTYNLLELARENNAEFLFASTSEIYGDPEVKIQEEEYKGSVNPIGIRSCYDEGKRIAESLCFDFFRKYNLKIHVARIFNTYGPKMQPNDGRVVSNFISQALTNNALTIYGNGKQTRSFCYVDDLVDGLFKLMNSESKGPINLGNPQEFTILELANLIKKKVNNSAEIVFRELPEDDPKQRKPSIKLAKNLLYWEPKIDIDKGLDNTIEYFRNKL